MVSGAARGILVRNIYKGLGVSMKVKLECDSSAARGIASRQGVGRVRHLDVRLLWLQDKVKSGELAVAKITSEENESDMGTKYLTGERLKFLMNMGSLRPVDEATGLVVAFLALLPGVASLEIDPIAEGSELISLKSELELNLLNVVYVKRELKMGVTEVFVIIGLLACVFLLVRNWMSNLYKKYRPLEELLNQHQSQQQQEPEIIIKEITVEVIREVQIEVVKEVRLPAEETVLGYMAAFTHNVHAKTVNTMLEELRRQNISLPTSWSKQKKAHYVTMCEMLESRRTLQPAAPASSSTALTVGPSEAQKNFARILATKNGSTGLTAAILSDRYLISSYIDVNKHLMR
jgi:hypothetical protein